MLALRKGWLLALAGALAGFGGCTHAQLRTSTLHQARTVHELHQQQVLDNLAMFLYDIDSLPYFAWVDPGTASVTDQGTVGTLSTWHRLVAIVPRIHGWQSTNLNVTGTRTIFGSWSLKPVNDPRRLQLMRCAYQQVVRACLAAAAADGHVQSSACIDCPNCTKLFNTFYTGDKALSVPGPGSADDTGEITNRCLGTTGLWLGWGSKKLAPRCCPGELRGEYEGMCVWVLPGGQDELAKLTLAILDYAVNPPHLPPPPILKDVTLYVDKNDQPTTSGLAVAQLRATIPANRSINVLVPKPELRQEISQLEWELESQLPFGMVKARRLPAKVLDTLRPEDRERATRLLDLRRALEAPAPPLILPRGPSLDERDRGFYELRQQLELLREPPRVIRD